jgi:plastocyanin
LGLVGGDRHADEYRVNPPNRGDESAERIPEGGGRMLRSTRLPVWLVLVLSLALVATACGEEEPSLSAGAGGEGESEGGGSITIAGQEATSHGSADVSGMDAIDLELDDFYFEPTVLEGEAGQALTVTMSNAGDAPHTFTVDELNVDHELQPGDEDVSTEVTFPDSGALVFYCRFHADGGMRGGLSVGGDLNAAPGVSGGGSSGSEDSEDSGGGSSYPGY